MKYLVGLAGLAAVLLAAGAMGGTAAAVTATNNPVLASGVAPVTSGKVIATVTPNLAVGQSAKPIQVASAPIDAHGNFTLPADPGTQPLAGIIKKALVDTNGWVNLDLIEMGANGETATQAVSRQFVTPSGLPISSTDIASAGVNAGSLGEWNGSDATSSNTGVTVDNTTFAVTQPASTTTAALVTKALSASNALDFCGYETFLVAQANVDTVVGELHTANDTNATFSYGKTADTQADVGVKYAGASWTVDGSAGVGGSRSSAIVFSEGPQFGHQLETGMLHKKWHTITNCGNDYDTEKDVEWTGSPDLKAVGKYNHNLDNNCKESHYSANFQGAGSFYRDTGDFTHFGLAFSAFGFYGGARSGASTNVKAAWHFGTATNHYLCGSDDYVTASPHRIFAGYG